MHPPAAEIDVLDAQRGYLAEPEPGVGQEGHEHVVGLRALGRQLRHLVVREEALTAPGLLGRRWAVGGWTEAAEGDQR